MPTIPSVSTVIYWTCYLVPVYLFVIAPGLRTLFPAEQPAVFFDDDYYAPGSVGRGNIRETDITADEDGLDTLDCGDDAYRVHLFSRSPLIIYVENFLSDAESEHLLAISEDRYTPSIVYDGHSERIDPSVRLSDRAQLPADDRVVRCLERRARAFQGWRPNLSIEPMWTQRYNVSGFYRHHYDWTGTAPVSGQDRVSTFMVYVDARDCVGGGTNFPRLRRPKGQSWCRFIECDENDSHTSSGKEGGVTFKPIRGHAIYWENLKADGSGYWETWHAALPVRAGSKVGLNIWSWYHRA